MRRTAKTQRRKAPNLKVKIYSLRQSLASRPQLVGSRIFCPAARPGFVVIQIVNVITYHRASLFFCTIRASSEASYKEKHPD